MQEFTCKRAGFGVRRSGLELHLVLIWSIVSASGISSLHGDSKDYIKYHLTKQLLLYLEHKRCPRILVELKFECVDTVQDKFRAEWFFKNGCFILSNAWGGGWGGVPSEPLHHPGKAMRPRVGLLLESQVRVAHLTKPCETFECFLIATTQARIETLDAQKQTKRTKVHTEIQCFFLFFKHRT